MKRGSSAGGLKVKHLPGWQGMEVQVLLGATLLIFTFTLREMIIYLIHISELRTFRLDDGRPSDAHTHCFRNEQCACASNLNKMAAG